MILSELKVADDRYYIKMKKDMHPYIHDLKFTDMQYSHPDGRREDLLDNSMKKRGFVPMNDDEISPFDISYFEHRFDKFIIGGSRNLLDLSDQRTYGTSDKKKLVRLRNHPLAHGIDLDMCKKYHSFIILFRYIVDEDNCFDLHTYDNFMDLIANDRFLGIVSRNIEDILDRNFSMTDCLEKELGTKSVNEPRFIHKDTKVLPSWLPEAAVKCSPTQDSGVGNHLFFNLEVTARRIDEEPLGGEEKKRVAADTAGALGYIISSTDIYFEHQMKLLEAGLGMKNELAQVALDLLQQY